MGKRKVNTMKAVAKSGEAAGGKIKASDAAPGLTAERFAKRVMAMSSQKELLNIQRYFKSGEGQYGEGDQFVGVKMGQLFALAKEFIQMPTAEIEKLLESPIHELRAGAVSIMDKQARDKKTPEAQRKEIFDLYMRRHDRINNWDLVDLGCLVMVGSYLLDKPRAILYKMAKSKDIWERRTAILGTCFFIRKGQVEDTFKIAEMLVNDKEDLIHKGTGWMLRFAGDTDRKRLLGFLDKYAATMPRTLLRYSIEKLDAKRKKYYMDMKPKAVKK